ncbi:MAG: bifunctional [glutamate--ammonia ligase]-adenylyl-L-tyrosine phosphorylase/[glutamate--ammonia-ligase] adenylyltransferase [Gammaproteobacteria bacterium]
MPETLKDQLNESWDAFRQAASDEQFPLLRSPDLTTSLLRVWAGSDFVAQTCIREPALLYGLLNSGDLLADYRPGEYQVKLSRALRDSDDADSLATALRHFRRREMVRIAWRDLAGWARLSEVLRDLSALADACITESLGRLDGWLPGPTQKSSRKSSSALVVLGMGKLGASELNFSSDIDLIFAYPDDDRGQRRGRQTTEEVNLRLAQQLIQVLDKVTADGFVYRVDMRLRPYGNSGPLVASFDAMADYYQLQGREWERYAMIKARPVAGPVPAAAALMKLLQPVVYRRYLDFGAFESLRHLKEQIVREVERKGMQDNIKLGPGGIREIEFIVQAFQLVRGGRQPVLQQRGVLDVLDALATLGYLPVYVTLQLAEAYIFLRRVENRLQAFADEQVHALPDDEAGRQRLAFTMGYPDWQPFAVQLGEHRRLVQEHFEQVFAAPASASPSQGREPAAGMENVWNRAQDPKKSLAALAAAGYQEPAETMQWLDDLRDGPVRRHLGDQGRRRFDQLMPRLLTAASTEAEPLQTLQRIGEILEAIAGRTAYLSLLVENPMALTQLVQLCSASTWVAAQLAQHPILLDELLDPRSLYEPLDKAGLQGVLEARLAGIPGDDLEQQMDRLRQFKQAAVLHVAATDIVSNLPLPRVGDYLTVIAEVVLEKVFALAWKHLVVRHGIPEYRTGGKQRAAKFAIAAYGKLGGLELGYGSDLDIVFLHDSMGDAQHTTGPQVLENNEFFTRLSQRVIHILNTFTPAGILYEVDTRLRPNGSSGLLVSSMEAFAEYQRRSAWTWEYQALVRARIIVGDREMVRQFGRIRSGVLARPRDVTKLSKEVLEMRARMRVELDKSDAQQLDLKQCRGGIVDIEFMVQWGVLLWSNAHPELLRFTDNLRLLEAFSAAGLLPKDEIRELSEAYCSLRRRINHLALQEEPGLAGADDFVAEREAVMRIWSRLLEHD